MKNLKVIQLPASHDCLVVAESDFQLNWLNSPHILHLLYPRCNSLFGSINNLSIVCHPIYDMVIYEKAEILSFQLFSDH